MTLPALKSDKDQTPNMATYLECDSAGRSNFYALDQQEAEEREDDETENSVDQDDEDRNSYRNADQEDMYYFI
jgi:hypothetical protein